MFKKTKEKINSASTNSATSACAEFCKQRTLQGGKAVVNLFLHTKPKFILLKTVDT